MVDKSGGIIAVVICGLLGFNTAQLFSSAQAQSPQTIIKTDNNIIVFVVDGQERARIDATGFHVNGDVNYSGATTDTVTYQPADRTQEDAGARE